MKELKHVFEGTLRGFTTEPRRGQDGKEYNIDVMVLDSGMDTFRIVMRRADAEDVKKTVDPGMRIAVETLLRAFKDEIGVSFLGVFPCPPPKLDSAKK